MVDELFSALNQRGIDSGPRAFEVIATMDYRSVIDLAFQCFMSVKEVGSLPKDKLFTFAPISSIAGGKTPCSNLPCRLEAAYSLSLISTLYADKIILPNFFDYMFHVLNDDSGLPETEEQFNNFAYNLASDIAVCFQYRPLFDAGLAVMNFTTPTVCKDCSMRHQKEAIDFQKELDIVLKKVEPTFRSKVRFVYQENEYIDIENDDAYLGGQIGWSISSDLLKAMQQHNSKIPYVLSDDEQKQFGLQDKVVDDCVNDILEYDFYPSLNSATYLTNRQFDIDLIEGTKKRSGSSGHTNTFPCYHKIPYLQDIVIEDAVKLRQSNEEAFSVYRNSVLKMIKKRDASEAAAFFDNEVNPAINTINNVISQNKKHYRARAGRKIKTRTMMAVAGVGAANLIGIPLDMAINTAGTLGVFTGTDIVDEIQTSNSTPYEAKVDPYYFMWGIKQGHAG